MPSQGHGGLRAATRDAGAARRRSFGGEGEVIAVIGRNGVGKSTLMKGGDRPSPNDRRNHPVQRRRRRGGNAACARKARHRLRSTRARRLPAHERRREFSSGGLSISGSGPGRFFRSHVRLFSHSQGTTPASGRHTLRGGQQQQLAIGRALVGQPSLLLLDEPSEGIQPSIVQDIARIVVDLNPQDRPDGRPCRTEHRYDPRHGAALLRHGQGARSSIRWPPGIWRTKGS